MNDRRARKDFLFQNNGVSYYCFSEYFSYEKRFPANVVMIRKRGTKNWRIGSIGEVFSEGQFYSEQERHRFFEDFEIDERDPLGNDFDVILGACVVRYFLGKMRDDVWEWRGWWVNRYILNFVLGISIGLHARILLPSNIISRNTAVQLTSVSESATNLLIEFYADLWV